MKPTQQEIIEQLGEAFDRAVEICGREFVAKSLLERFGAGGGEPVAWRTFDGEGGYDYRTYYGNETYAQDWAKRNPKHAGWVDPLYTHPSPTDLRAEYLRGLEDAAKAFEAEADTWKAWPQAGAAKRKGVKAIEALKGKQ